MQNERVPEMDETMRSRKSKKGSKALRTKGVDLLVELVGFSYKKRILTKGLK
jgi:hypothetical protein